MLFWLAVFVVGLVQCWARRNDMNPDGISYIEIGQAGLREGWHALLNGYWSPLYPVLIGAVLRIFQPRTEWQFATIHGLNFAIYLGSFACFEIFLRGLLRARRAINAAAAEFWPLPERTVWIWGCVLFLWASEYWLSLGIVSPDLCVAAFVYLAVAILLRIRRGEGDWSAFAGLGVVLGLGYLAKAVMFPLGFVFLGCAFLLAVIVRRSRWQAIALVSVALVVFFAIAGPLIVGLSYAKRRITFGDSGKIAYAEEVNRATLNVHWQGEPAGTGVPAHPTRKILDDPPMYEFAEPIAGSYPPWYDPSYWYAGIATHFSVKQQSWALFRAANMYLKLFSKSGALYAVLLAILWLLKKGSSWEPAAKGMWFVYFPSVAALGLYSLVLVEFRYVSPFALVFLVWIFSRMRMNSAAAKSLRRTSVVIVGAPLLAIGWLMWTLDLQNIVKPLRFMPWEVAQGLNGMGIGRRTPVGFIGLGREAYWAHLAGVKIVAEVPEQGQQIFLSSDTEKKEKILKKFAASGTAIIVMRVPEGSTLTNDWQRIGGTFFYLYDFSKEKCGQQ